jgi:hypothetical protein
MAQDVGPETNPEVPGGQVGQRQTREDVAPNLQPMQRIENRVPNRIQNRIRNRIDENYDSQATTTSPFEGANGQSRSADARARRRDR